MRQDGTSASLTAPNGSAQAALLGLAIARAAADDSRYCAVESHGTGTPLGDPTEVRALSQALSAQQVASTAVVIQTVFSQHCIMHKKQHGGGTGRAADDARR